MPIATVFDCPPAKISRFGHVDLAFVNTLLVSIVLHVVLVVVMLLHPPSSAQWRWDYERRGGVVRLPPLTPRLVLPRGGCKKVSDPLTLAQADIMAVIELHRNEVLDCYQGAKEHWQPRAHVFLAWDIDRRGRVSNPRTLSTDLPAEVGACIAKRLQNWRFIPEDKKRGAHFKFLFVMD